MYLEKINDNEYSAITYDYLELHDDYIAGTVKRSVLADADSDEHFFMFYPSTSKPLACGELRRLSEKISELNLALRNKKGLHDKQTT